MDYLILVNRDNILDKTYIPTDLVDVCSKYKNNILLNSKVYYYFLLMQKDAFLNGYNIDIMSGYRSYEYQDRLYNDLLNNKGLNYTIRHVAPGGGSEHQTGLAIDICIYRNNKCYVEHELSDFCEIGWLRKNAHKYGFIFRYMENKEDITGYNFEPWHLRYVGNMASYIYYNNFVLEELFYC